MLKLWQVRCKSYADENTCPRPRLNMHWNRLVWDMDVLKPVWIILENTCCGVKMLQTVGGARPHNHIHHLTRAYTMCTRWDTDVQCSKLAVSQSMEWPLEYSKSCSMHKLPLPSLWTAINHCTDMHAQRQLAEEEEMEAWNQASCTSWNSSNVFVR